MVKCDVGAVITVQSSDRSNCTAYVFLVKFKNGIKLYRKGKEGYLFQVVFNYPAVFLVMCVAKPLHGFSLYLLHTQL